MDENPFKAIIEQAKAMAKTSSAIKLRQDALRQRLRLEATAKVDDPTHPFTEEQFFNVIRQYSVCQNAIGEALQTVRGRIEAQLILGALAAYIKDVIDFGNDRGYDCPHCQ